MVEEERLTAKQKEALQAELDELEGRRPDVVAAIKKAREFGDLSENFEYHAAKNEQGLLEARIRTLKHRIDNATVVEEASGGEVGIGSLVELVDERGEVGAAALDPERAPLTAEVVGLDELRRGVAAPVQDERRIGPDQPRPSDEPLELRVARDHLLDV